MGEIMNSHKGGSDIMCSGKRVSIFCPTFGIHHDVRCHSCNTY